MSSQWWRFRSVIDRIPEPKNISIILSIAYTVFALTGIATLIIPPMSIVGQVGVVVMNLVGAFFLCGGLIGMTAGAAEFWQLERVGIATMGVGLLTYAYIVGVLHFTQDGSRLTQLGILIVAACFLALRFAMIWRYPFKPRG